MVCERDKGPSVEPLPDRKNSSNVPNAVQYEGHRHHHVLVGGLRAALDDDRTVGYAVTEENVSMAQCLLVIRTGATCPSCQHDNP